MTPKRFMVIAGEASGDLLAAELVGALREKLARRQAAFTTDFQPLQTSLEPEFFGAGGPAMKAAGVRLAFDMTTHAVVGLIEVVKNYQKFRGLFNQLLELAIQRQPHAIICVDFSGFNRRFAHAVRKRNAAREFNNWAPKLIQYVSPQVWASRESRAQKMARDFDLLVSIFPFEKQWYATHVPSFPVQFVGHPLMDRYQGFTPAPAPASGSTRRIVLLPGSRTGELARHLPVIRDAVSRLQAKIDFRWQMILPNASLAEQARLGFAGITGGAICAGSLAEGLSNADLAIASTGTVTMECAWFGVPTVAIYKTSWSTYQIGRRIINVRYLAMPNILADEPIFPELIQHDATSEKIAEAALKLLNDPGQRQTMKARLKRVTESLGPPGAPARAAEAVIDLLRI